MLCVYTCHRAKLEQERARLAEKVAEEKEQLRSSVATEIRDELRVSLRKEVHAEVSAKVQQEVRAEFAAAEQTLTKQLREREEEGERLRAEATALKESSEVLQAEAVVCWLFCSKVVSLLDFCCLAMLEVLQTLEMQYVHRLCARRWKQKWLRLSC